MNKLLIAIALMFLCFTAFSQNVGIGTTTPDASAKLDVTSTNSGFLPPRMTTTERNAIVHPAVGLQIYNLTTDCLEIFGRGKWNPIYCIPIDTTIVTDIDGQTYPTVQICNQTWMAKNLDVAHYRNGDIIPQVTDPTEWANLTTGAWCWYDNDSASYGAEYGRLYNWYAVNDQRGLAPTGWHVPNDAEWNKLVNCLDSNADTTSVDWTYTQAGGMLKSSSGWIWNGFSNSGSNSSGFNGLPGGGRYNITNTTFNYIKGGGYWWSMTELNNLTAWLHGLNIYNDYLYRGSLSKNIGFSVRCVKDLPASITINDGLVAYYPFNGNAGDSSGNGNHGTVNGATLTTDRFGNSGRAYAFNSSYILVPPSNSINSIQNGITISVWIYMENGGPNPPRILELRGGYGQGGDAGFVMLSQSTNNTPRSFETNWWKNSINIGVSPTNSINSNEWHMLTFSGDGNSGVGKFYIDGVLKNSNVTSLTPGIDLTRDYGNLNLYIGVDPLLQGGNWGGNLDEIRIYNRPLTQSEVTYLATH